MHKLALFALLAACTSSGTNDTNDNSGGGDPSPWLGNWTETGTQATTCGAASSTTQISQAVVITADNDTLETSSDNCELMWDLDSDSATLASGQICTVSINGLNVTVEWTQSRATLAGATITLNATGATNNGCSFMQQATLTKP